VQNAHAAAANAAACLLELYLPPREREAHAPKCDEGLKIISKLHDVARNIVFNLFEIIVLQRAAV
jgi:hypothetical protein